MNRQSIPIIWRDVFRLWGYIIAYLVVCVLILFGVYWLCRLLVWLF